MKGVYRRGSVWWFRFTPPGGERESYSLDTSDEAEAIRLARDLKERRSVAVMAETGTCEAEVEAWDRWMKGRGLAENTRENRVYAVKAFCRDVKATHPRQISTVAAERWFSDRCDDNAHTAVDYLSKVQLWFAWLVEKFKVPTDPVACIVPPKLGQRTRKTFLLPDLARKLLDECTSPSLKFALYCGLHAGLRKDEVVEARPEWFDLNNGLLHVQKTDTFEVKDRDNRTIPLTREFRDWLKNEYGLKSPFMLEPQRTHGKARYRYDFRQSFEKHVEACGLGDITFHDCRRTFASLHVSSGTSIYKVAKWLGDGVPVVEKTYGHLIPNDEDINAVWDRQRKAAKKAAKKTSAA